VSALLSDEQLDWVAERMPSAGRLTTAEDAVYAYRLRREHTPYPTLCAMFGCSRASLQRAIRLVSVQRGDDPEQWRSIRTGRRRRLVASFWTHSEKITLRRQEIAEEVAALRREAGIVMPEPPQPGPPDAFREQRRLSDALGGTPSVPSSPPSRLVPARGAVNPFEARTA